MIKRGLAFAGLAALCALGIRDINLAQRAPVTAPAMMSVDQESALVKQYCQGCHNSTTKSGSLDLSAINFSRIDQHGEVAEKMIRRSFVPA